MNERTLSQKRKRRLARSCWSTIGYKKLHIEVEENSLPSPFSKLDVDLHHEFRSLNQPHTVATVVKLSIEEEIIPSTASSRVIICSDAFYPVVSPE